MAAPVAISTPSSGFGGVHVAYGTGLLSASIDAGEFFKRFMDRLWV